MKRRDGCPPLESELVETLEDADREEGLSADESFARRRRYG
jgi:hypothetical protein